VRAPIPRVLTGGAGRDVEGGMIAPGDGPVERSIFFLPIDAKVGIMPAFL